LRICTGSELVKPNVLDSGPDTYTVTVPKKRSPIAKTKVAVRLRIHFGCDAAIRPENFVLVVTRSGLATDGMIPPSDPT